MRRADGAEYRVQNQQGLPEPALITGPGLMNARIQKTIEDLERFMADKDDTLAIPHQAAAFVHTLVFAREARRAVEIGTSYGYSGIWIAAALLQSNGRLITIDHHARKTETARSYFDKAGLSDFVDFRTGEAREILTTIDGPIDFVLNDADKENCLCYIELLVPKLAPRAIVLTDNIVTHATELADFMHWMRNRRDFYSTPVPIGNGMELSVKLPGYGKAE